MCIRDKLIEGKSLSKFYQNRCNKPEKAEGREVIELFIKDVPRVPRYCDFCAKKKRPISGAPAQRYYRWGGAIFW